ncbi:LysR family transcriptional regulator [Xaviernesmea oryzae]|uniref:LysR family transcriptional regulator n=1 Tax=Xaviernesmea oryzae TaxID=464029 RepID=A0A1Q9B0R3_9HYPH|nr:LysR substrate-binding domain-containing protein [Xaviernesmea oryzae]OLP61569.1 LysR family transcriptional regulator [Xaviernesmea oryzae]SEL08035.1 DNA-binding transcriptional regulator, LysR family [Xaviernesmea oryzae]
MKSLNLVHLNGLRAVEAAARLGSLPAAARELGVTIGAVSQQIGKTERQLGRPLFQRLPRGLAVLPEAQGVIAELAEGFVRLERAVAEARRRDETVLTISVAPVFAARWLVPRLDRFEARHPGLRLRLDATTRLVDLDAEGVDLAIRVGRGDWPGAGAELLLAQQVFPVCAPTLADSLHVPADVLRLPAVLDGRSMFSWDLWLSAAGLGGQSMSVRHVFNEASLCLDAAIAGQGLFLAWQTIACDALGAGRLIAPFELRVPTGLGHYILTPRGRRLGPAVTALRAWLFDEIAEAAGLPSR